MSVAPAKREQLMRERRRSYGGIDDALRRLARESKDQFVAAFRHFPYAATGCEVVRHSTGHAYGLNAAACVAGVARMSAGRWRGRRRRPYLPDSRQRRGRDRQVRTSPATVPLLTPSPRDGERRAHDVSNASPAISSDRPRRVGRARGIGVSEQNIAARVRGEDRLQRGRGSAQSTRSRRRRDSGAVRVVNSTRQ